MINPCLPLQVIDGEFVLKWSPRVTTLPITLICRNKASPSLQPASSWYDMQDHASTWEGKISLLPFFNRDTPNSPQAKALATVLFVSLQLLGESSIALFIWTTAARIPPAHFPKFASTPSSLPYVPFFSAHHSMCCSPVPSISQSGPMRCSFVPDASKIF